MPLRKLPARVQPSATLTEFVLCPTPYMVGSANPLEIWQEAVRGLFTHLCRFYQPDKTYGEFEIAQRLNVHRIISDEWVTAMAELGLIDAVTVKHATDPFIQCLGFSIPKHTHTGRGENITIEFGDLQTYDPWVDRQYDDQLWEAVRPEDYCDKFFHAQHHEYLLITGRPRKRPDGTIFVPLPKDRQGLPPLRKRTDPIRPEERKIYDKANSLDLSDF